MKRKSKSKRKVDFKAILNNKKIIIAVSALCLAIVFVLGNGVYQRQSEDIKTDGFVIGADENVIQPNSKWPTSAVISEGNFDFTAVCNSDFGEATTTTSIDGFRQIRAPLLLYHYVEDPASSTMPWLFINMDLFEAQIKTLKKNCYQTLFVRETAEAVLNNKSLPKKNIALTFDDGYADWYYNVFPLLKKYQVKATMFVIVNAIDTPGYLTKEQVKEMTASGYVEFGSHTLNHANLKKSSLSVARSEIIESKKKLEEILGQPVYDFAYPYGFFTKRDENICQEAGYLTCSSTWPSDMQSIDKRYYFYRLRADYRIGDELINWLENIDHEKMRY